MTNAAVAAIGFALDPTTDEGLSFLEAWNQGDFDVCRREWPEAPQECYVGADPALPETVALLETEIKTREHAALWEKLLKISDFSPAEDFKRNFWRGVVNVPADKHETMADAVKDALDNESPQRRVA